MHAVPRAYVWTWKRRKYPWLQFITDPAADQNPMFDQVHAGEALIPIAGLVAPDFAYFTGRYETVAEVLNNHDLATMGRSERLPAGVAWIEKATRPKHWERHPLSPPGMNAIDGPDHLKIRKAVREGFHTRSAEDIEATARGLLDEMDANQTTDLISGFCRKLPALIIGSVFGLSAADVAELRYWQVFDFALTALDVTSSWACYKHNTAAMTQLLDWAASQVEGGPEGGLPRALARNPGLNDTERVVTSVLMLEAGFITTVHLLANGIRLLLEHPDQLAILAEQPQLWPNAVEEILRIEAPLRLSARRTSRDTILAGRRIPKGRTVVLNIAAANHDPSVFPDPHTFDVTRPNARQHLRFSHRAALLSRPRAGTGRGAHRPADVL